MKDRAIVVIVRDQDGTKRDFDIPLDITLHEFITALQSIFEVRTDPERIGKAYLTAENPIALLKGNGTLREYGIRDGSFIHFTEQRNG